MSILRSIARCAVLACLLPLGAAGAATIQVNVWNDYNNNAAGWCSLRDAITAANTNVAVAGCPAGSASGTDLILVPPGVYRLSRGWDSSSYPNEDANQSGDLDIRSSLVLRGTDARSTVVVAMARDRVIDLVNPLAAGPVTIEHLTLVGGDVSQNANPGGMDRHGGTLRNIDFPAPLTLRNVILRDGVAGSGGNLSTYLYGSGRALTLENATLLDGRAYAGGGMVLYDKSNPSSLLNVTLTGNRASGYGGGLHLWGRLRVNHATLTGNSPDGIMAEAIAQGDVNGLTLSNSIVWGNHAGATPRDIACNFTGAWGENFYNLIGHAGCPSSIASGGAPGGSQPALAPRFDMGGVPVHLPLPGSGAIGRGKPDLGVWGDHCHPTDARGAPRPATHCDLGAVQAHHDLVVDSTADLPDHAPGNGLCAAVTGACTLRAAVMEASASGGRWMVALPAGRYELNRGHVHGDDASGGDLDVAPVAYRPALSLALVGQGTVGAVEIVGSVDRVLEVRGRFGSDESAPQATRPLAFALINATVRGGRLQSDPFAEGGGPGLYGGGLRVTGGRVLLYNVVLRDNRVLSEVGGQAALHATFRPSYVHWPVFDGGDYLPFSAGLHLERFAVVDNHMPSPQGSGAVWLDVYPSGAGFLHEPSVLRNGTIADNTAGLGSALQVSGSSIALSYLTVAGNHALTPEPTLQRPGGLLLSGGGGGDEVLIAASVIAGNTTGGVPFDCNANGGALGLGHLVVGDSRQCQIGGDTTGNLMDVDPLLAPRETLADGMVVRRLRVDSPARDTIPAAQCRDAQGAFMPVDVRGVARPGGNAQCTAGAVEDFPAPLPPEGPIFSDGFEGG